MLFPRLEQLELSLTSMPNSENYNLFSIEMIESDVCPVSEFNNPLTESR